MGMNWVFSKVIGADCHILTFLIQGRIIPSKVLFHFWGD